MSIAILTDIILKDWISGCPPSQGFPQLMEVSYNQSRATVAVPPWTGEVQGNSVLRAQTGP